MIQVHIQRIDKDIDLPSYAHPGDAAFDLRSREEKTIMPGELVIIKTGLKMEIPEGYFGNIRDRSGLAAKHGLHCLAGVVDSHYRGEVGVVMTNLGKEAFTVEKNMRIAQMLIQKVEHAALQETDEVSETKRGEGGFGSTGTH
ncbi:dUTP diphosphatase [Candidatus Woesearchaeota archaeon]|nr:MAG: dUTP pyrophosphatase [archaeon GW2011_AR4]MBS3129574.1 dUTP diphosphatase [Candidatus Woesearchaeota archaeon]HIH37542.1 dUTP diphosphatase [Candidatus Woesearchaeota archaeon]HIH49709.1 dUTP diphosphatase [Candidatus Woesearchaeota archaeon]HIJ03203.1 dUTP diphosphatase [Candidatus Woesearchaeota archaeon]